ncbi:hypothetical protein HX109_08475 [Galbibacter sp. BG1]|uniref:hypothetical protein n=1 Tax=Galbibacter sp. BG1 TaxID=1170699 RepID=UPI0015BFE065|nr:hypothetical protein [Galbibacter sp. BG1]QLE01598.1 hypothetical protein HX109_08475 [Galbibacter sp. BG1]
MDELDILKKDWQKKEKELPKLSYEDIYAMLWKKSSSSIKWIFYISLLELSFGVLLSIFYHPSFEKDLELPPTLNYLTYASILVIIYFIYRFYKNYKRVSTTASVKGLLESIIKARRTVRHYIVFNLTFAGIIAIISIIYLFVQQNGGWEKFVSGAETKDYLVIFVVSIIATAIIIGFFLGIYYLLYGILMRRLKRNYRELKKIEL